MNGAKAMAGGKGARGEELKITISAQTYEDLSAIAEWKGMSLGLLVRNIVETHHESPGVQSLIRKAKEDLSKRTRKSTKRSDDPSLND
jgi:predicted DNA-binding ribbon-helix-helix protein